MKHQRRRFRKSCSEKTFNALIACLTRVIESFPSLAPAFQQKIDELQQSRCLRLALKLFIAIKHYLKMQELTASIDLQRLKEIQTVIRLLKLILTERKASRAEIAQLKKQVQTNAGKILAADRTILSLQHKLADKNEQLLNAEQENKALKAELAKLQRPNATSTSSDPKTHLADF